MVVTLHLYKLEDQASTRVIGPVRILKQIYDNEVPVITVLLALPNLLPFPKLLTTIHLYFLLHISHHHLAHIHPVTEVVIKQTMVNQDPVVMF